jgi:4-hydroxy-3-methylbut-2-enyl diphosphate reductase
VKSIISYIEKGVPVYTSVTEVKSARGVRKAGVVAQTTQSFDNLMTFVTAAMKRFPEVRVFNTICNATSVRQQESTRLAGEADAMFVLGGYNSANTRRLAEISREINPRTHHIETAEELAPRMVEGANVVGITAGASTPQWIIDGFVEALKALWKGEGIQVSLYE